MFQKDGEFSGMLISLLHHGLRDAQDQHLKIENKIDCQYVLLVYFLL